MLTSQKRSDLMGLELMYSTALVQSMELMYLMELV